MTIGSCSSCMGVSKNGPLDIGAASITRRVGSLDRVWGGPNIVIPSMNTADSNDTPERRADDRDRGEGWSDWSVAVAGVPGGEGNPLRLWSSEK